MWFWRSQLIHIECTVSNTIRDSSYIVPMQLGFEAKQRGASVRDFWHLLLSGSLLKEKE